MLVHFYIAFHGGPFDGEVRLVSPDSNRQHRVFGEHESLYVYEQRVDAVGNPVRDSMFRRVFDLIVIVQKRKTAK